MRRIVQAVQKKLSFFPNPLQQPIPRLHMAARDDQSSQRMCSVTPISSQFNWRGIGGEKNQFFLNTLCKIPMMSHHPEVNVSQRVRK